VHLAPVTFHHLIKTQKEWHMSAAVATKGKKEETEWEHEQIEDNTRKRAGFCCVDAFEEGGGRAGGGV